MGEIEDIHIKCRGKLSQQSQNWLRVLVSRKISLIQCFHVHSYELGFE